MQNHLLQVFTLIAMEPPAVAGGEAQLASKVDLLKQVKALVRRPSTWGCLVCVERREAVPAACCDWLPDERANEAKKGP